MTPRSLITLALVAGCAAETAEPASTPVGDEALAEVTQQSEVCANGPTTYGIDVSRYQGDIDWDAVAASGVKFAFIQISRSLTDIDAKFSYNWRRAKEVGILRGAYQRFRPGQDVMGQAELFVQTLGPYVTGDLPPVLDVEDADGLSPSQIAGAVDQWVTYVEQAVGLKPIIYTGYYFWKDSVGGADFSDHPLWIANYSATCPLVPPAWTTWAIHQYSSTATIPGITANTVDVNKFNGTLADLQALATPVCSDDCEPCQIIDGTDAGRIVDDTSACFVAGGDPMYMRTENAGFGSSLRWTHATASATPANYGVWSLHFAEAGRYRVEAHTPAPFNESKRAVYTVRHAGGTTPVTVDQSAVDGWTVIGELDFAAGGDQAVRLDDNTGEPTDTNTQIVFDALRFTKLAGPPPTDQPDGTSSCATTHGDGSLLVLLVVVGSLGYGAHPRPGRRARRRHAHRVRH